MKKKQSIAITILFVFIFLALSTTKTKADDTQPRIHMCWHVVCWTYEGGCFNGICADSKTSCEMEIEECDGRIAELPAI